MFHSFSKLNVFIKLASTVTQTQRSQTGFKEAVYCSTPKIVFNICDVATNIFNTRDFHGTTSNDKKKLIWERF